MSKLKNVLFADNIACGYLYFYVHFIVEIVCFYFLTKVTDGSNFVWLIPFIYDGLAFVPQSLLGYLNDLYPNFKIDYLGVILLFISIFMLSFINANIYLMLIILSLGNACLHISGAENTLKNSNGKLSHSAIFVSGGSFGVISGKLLAELAMPSWILLILLLLMIPFIMLANTYKNDDTSKFNYHNNKIKYGLIILLIVFVVAVRGYMGYGIPTSWNKTVFQTILLYFTMGFGKALGGILADLFGVRRIAIISTLLAIPFLCFGDNYMLISLIGVMMFSMTMSITLAVLTSVLKKKPGLAFGLTTIGLFLGTAPIFFIKITNQSFNNILLVILSILCTFILCKVIRKEVKI